MQGITSLLDAVHTKLVQQLWDELKTKCGINGTQVPKFPHFSYHGAESYVPEKIAPLLKNLAAQQKKFQVRTTGLGIFNSGNPVLYLPVVRDPILAQFHQTIYPQLSTTTATSNQYYAPEFWMPHITLAMGDLTPQSLSDAVRVLNSHALAWEVTVDNLTWMGEDKIIERVTFGD